MCNSLRCGNMGTRATALLGTPKTDNGTSGTTCKPKKTLMTFLDECEAMPRLDLSSTSLLEESKSEPSLRKETIKFDTFMSLPFSTTRSLSPQLSRILGSKKGTAIIWFLETEIYLIVDGELTTLKNSAKLTRLRWLSTKAENYQAMDHKRMLRSEALKKKSES